MAYFLRESWVLTVDRSSKQCDAVLSEQRREYVHKAAGGRYVALSAVEQNPRQERHLVLVFCG